MPNIAVEDTIESSADAAWAKLADFGGLGAWAPGVTECKLEGSGVGSVRRITMGGMEIAERLDGAIDPRARLLPDASASGSAARSGRRLARYARPCHLRLLAAHV